MEEQNQRQSESLSAMYGQVEKSDQLISALKSQLGDKKQAIEGLQESIAAADKVQNQLKATEEANAKLKTQLDEATRAHENKVVILESEFAKKLAQEELSWEKRTTSQFNKEREKLEKNHLAELDKLHRQYREMWSTEKERSVPESSEDASTENVRAQKAKSK